MVKKLLILMNSPVTENDSAAKFCDDKSSKCCTECCNQNKSVLKSWMSCLMRVNISIVEIPQFCSGQNLSYTESAV